MQSPITVDYLGYTFLVHFLKSGEKSIINND